MKKDKIIYLANIRIPTEKAHGIQIMNMCGAFASQGIRTELVVPWRINHIKEDHFDFYQIDRNFEIKSIFSFDIVNIGSIGFWIQSISFFVSSILYSFGKNDIFYSRDECLVWLLSLLGKKVVWEAHMGQLNFCVKKIISKRIPIVAITDGIKRLYINHNPDGNIFVSPDGVDLEKFHIFVNREDARRKLDLPINKKIILYAGHLYDWKGASTLAEAAPLIKSEVCVIFVGGTDEDISKFKKKYAWSSRVMIVGRKPHHQIPIFLRAADILVIPNSSRQDISRLYTSPMKLFEYMASGTPIIASDLPSLREILDDSNAVFFQADNHESLALSIDNLLQDTVKMRSISEKMSRDIMSYSWLSRAQNILNFINYDQKNNSQKPGDIP